MSLNIWSQLSANTTMLIPLALFSCCFVGIWKYASNPSHGVNFRGGENIKWSREGRDEARKEGQKVKN